MENKPENSVENRDGSQPAPSPMVEKGKPGPKKGSSPAVIALLMLAGAFFLVLFCVLFGLLFTFMDKIPGLVAQSVSQPPPVNANPLDYLEIRPGDYQCTNDGKGNIVAQGKVTNTSAYSIWDVVVKVSLINKKGFEVSGNAAYFSGTVVYPHSDKAFKVDTEDPLEPYTCQVKIVRASFSKNEDRDLVPYEY